MSSGNSSASGSGDWLLNATATDGGSQTNCQYDEYDEYYADISTTLAVAASSLSFVASIAVIILVCVLKKHKFSSQRMILYLAVAVIVRCVSWVPQRVHHDLVNRYEVPGEVTTRVCSLAGYFSMTAGWFEILAVASLTANQFLQLVVTKSLRWLELVYVTVIFLLPLTFTWTPFIDSAYGSTGQWCWIRQETDDCERYTLGIWLVFVIWFVPLFTMLILLVLLYCTVMYILSKRNTAWDGNFDPLSRKMKLKMQKNVRPLIWYPLIYFLLYLIPLANQITEHASSQRFYPLWIVAATTQALQGGFIVLAVTLDIETLRRLRRQNITGVVRGLRETILVEDYPTEHHQLEDRSYGQSLGFSSDESESDESECGDEEEEDGHSRTRRGRYTEYTCS